MELKSGSSSFLMRQAKEAINISHSTKQLWSITSDAVAIKHKLVAGSLSSNKFTLRAAGTSTFKVSATMRSQLIIAAAASQSVALALKVSSQATFGLRTNGAGDVLTISHNHLPMISFSSSNLKSAIHVSRMNVSVAPDAPDAGSSSCTTTIQGHQAASVVVTAGVARLRPGDFTNPF